MSKFSIENETKLAEIETHLANNAYLSGGALPDGNDASVLLALGNNAPNKDKYPNFYFWYVNNRMFADHLLHHWVSKLGGAGKGAETKKGGDDVDLFGDDDEEEKAKLAKIKEAKKDEGKKKKEAVVARSIVIFDVKVFEQEQDLDALAKKILQIEMDGLQWRTEYKKVPVAYGMYKLQMGCTIEDDKVLTDDLFDKITVWEDEVQSVDIASFQKV
jgi:elongation factor 1-beta